MADIDSKHTKTHFTKAENGVFSTLFVNWLSERDIQKIGGISETTFRRFKKRYPEYISYKKDKITIKKLIGKGRKKREVVYTYPTLLWRATLAPILTDLNLALGRRGGIPLYYTGTHKDSLDPEYDGLSDLQAKSIERFFDHPIVRSNALFFGTRQLNERVSLRVGALVGIPTAKAAYLNSEKSFLRTDLENKIIDIDVVEGAREILRREIIQVVDLIEHSRERKRKDDLDSNWLLQELKDYARLQDFSPTKYQRIRLGKVIGRSRLWYLIKSSLFAKLSKALFGGSGDYFIQRAGQFLALQHSLKR